MQAAVVGVPGTGKSFFMVKYLQKNFSYDDFFREYTIKSNVLILTNIAGLKLYGPSCWNVESPELLGNAMEGIAGKVTREEFFTVANMEKIMLETGKKNIILALDEVQRDQYFPVGYKDPKVLFLFAYHRHIGMDIILGTQDVALMSRGVLAQCEYLAHGKLRSKKLLGTMSYKFTDNKGNFMYDKGMRPDKTVFNAYQSATTEECNKPKNAVMHWIVITGCFLLVAGGLFKTSLAMVASKGKSENVRKQISPSAAAYARGVLPPGPKPSVAPLPSLAAVAPPVPVMGSMSSVRVSLPLPVPAALASTSVTVKGVIRSGNHKRFLLSDGRMIDSNRDLHPGDSFHL